MSTVPDRTTRDAIVAYDHALSAIVKMTFLPKESLQIVQRLLLEAREGAEENEKEVINAFLTLVAKELRS